MGQQELIFEYHVVMEFQDRKLGHTVSLCKYAGVHVESVSRQLRSTCVITVIVKCNITYCTVTLSPCSTVRFRKPSLLYYQNCNACTLVT